MKEIIKKTIKIPLGLIIFILILNEILELINANNTITNTIGFISIFIIITLGIQLVLKYFKNLKK